MYLSFRLSLGSDAQLSWAEPNSNLIQNEIMLISVKIRYNSSLFTQNIFPILIG